MNRPLDIHPLILVLCGGFVVYVALHVIVWIQIGAVGWTF